jgi:Carbohydrate family 9 binding domain-like
MLSLERRFFASGPARAIGALLVSSFLSGCFVTIADPAADSSGGTSNAGTGGSPSSGGASTGGVSTGGSAGAGGRGPTDAGRDASGGSTCKDGFVDCDGDPTNGCETDFRVQSPDAGVGARSKALGTSGAIDGTFDEWAGFPLFPMTETCGLCQPNQPGGQPGQPIVGKTAKPTDLTSVFASGWDSGGLYVYVQVRDDQIVASDRNDVEKQDGVEFLLDGDLNDPSDDYGPDVHHLFVGVLADKTKNVVEKNQSFPPADVTVASNSVRHCYFVEARFTWSYVMGRVAYAPKAGDVHGMSVATNDWDVDAAAEAGSAPARETQLFSVAPSPNYAFKTTGFGKITLE